MNSHIITEFRKEERRGLTVLPSIRTWYMLKYSAADSTVEYKRSLEQSDSQNCNETISITKELKEEDHLLNDKLIAG